MDFHAGPPCALKLAGVATANGGESRGLSEMRIGSYGILLPSGLSIPSNDGPRAWDAAAAVAAATSGLGRVVEVVGGNLLGVLLALMPP